MPLNDIQKYVKGPLEGCSKAFFGPLRYVQKAFKLLFNLKRQSLKDQTCLQCALIAFRHQSYSSKDLACSSKDPLKSGWRRGPANHFLVGGPGSFKGILKYLKQFKGFLKVFEMLLKKFLRNTCQRLFELKAKVF